MHDCQRDSHATSPTAIYANITQTGRIRVYCSWFWVVLAGFAGGFGWFWLVPCFGNYAIFSKRDPHVQTFHQRGFLVSLETVLLRRWKSERKIWFYETS